MLQQLYSQLINLEEVFRQAQIRQGMHVADFGCGRTGYLVMPLAQRVGSDGVVYAVDILKSVLKLIDRQAQQEGLYNIHPIWADISQENTIVIPRKTLDVIFLVNVLYHFNNYDSVLNEAKKLLRPKGKIIIIDWIKKINGLGPRTNVFINFEKIKKWSRKNNLAIVNDFLVGKYHRCLILFFNE